MEDTVSIVLGLLDMVTMGKAMARVWGRSMVVHSTAGLHRAMVAVMVRVQAMLGLLLVPLGLGRALLPLMEGVVGSVRILGAEVVTLLVVCQTEV